MNILRLNIYHNKISFAYFDIEPTILIRFDSLSVACLENVQVSTPAFWRVGLFFRAPLQRI